MTDFSSPNNAPQNPPDNVSEIKLMQSLLEPLLEDFRYWFGRSLALLETEELTFLTSDAKADLTQRLKATMQEVGAASALFQASGKQVGVEVAVVNSWHKLLMECQNMGMRYRQSKI
jgi:Protein of unknown function (DUF2605)